MYLVTLLARPSARSKSVWNPSAFAPKWNDLCRISSSSLSSLLTMKRENTKKEGTSFTLLMVPFHRDRCPSWRGCQSLWFLFPVVSVTRLGYFWKVLETYSLTKLAKMLGNFLWYLKNYSLCKNALATFLVLGNIGGNWVTLNSSIRSHCLLFKNETDRPR